jgi:acetylornithine deacetylase/succinyl-diaminopimelate desuccinylase family protein
MASSELIELLAALVRIKSVNPAYDCGNGETEIQNFVRSFFMQHEISVFDQQVFPGRPNLIAKLSGRDPSKRVIFEAHCDTAGISGMASPPFDPRVIGGKLFGRGACDTKAGLAAMMLAIADLKRARQQPASDVWVVSAVDEEHSFRGVWELRKNLQATAAVVSEPTEMKMAIASKGCLRFRLTLKGKAAHSSQPALGVNAIENMVPVIRSLEEERQRLAERRHPLLGSATVNVGRIHGGTQVNVVPDSCWIEVDRRLIPGEEPEEVFRGYEKLVAKLRSERSTLEGTMEALLQDHCLQTPETSAIAVHAARALKKVGLDATGIGVPFGSDASKLASAGIPSIILGPGSIDQAHAAEEFVETEQVEQAFDVYRDIMLNFE